MKLDYRGHEIHITGGETWSAELIERRSGALLPTKATAAATEQLGDCIARARALVDLYLEGGRRRNGD
ncbi:hypothetical protein [Devosia sp.]|uniref:hypothetical protein n=1 Tax=Devosia sp. TaxID=1871048 RepID=UPI002EFCEA3F